MDFKTILTSFTTPERALALWEKLRTAGILGTTSTTACAGNDSRLSDTRAPRSHAASHATGGTDAIAPATIGAASAADVAAALAGKADLNGGKVPVTQLPSAAALGAAYVLGSWSTTTRLTALTSIGMSLPAGHAVVAWYVSFSAAPTGSPALFLADASFAPMGSPFSLATTSPANTWFGQTVRTVTTSGKSAVVADTPLYLFVSGTYAELPAGIKVVVVAMNIGATSW